MEGHRCKRFEWGKLLPAPNGNGYGRFHERAENDDVASPCGDLGNRVAGSCVDRSVGVQGD